MKQPFRPKWQTWWLIAGPRLPRTEIVLFPGVVLASLDEEAFENQKTSGVPVPSLKASSDTFVVHYPPRDVIQSRYRLQIDVEDAHEAEATERATEIANRLLTSLTLSIPGGRFYAELRKMRRVGTIEEKSGWSQTVRVTPMSSPLPFDSGDVDRALTLYARLEKDGTAENAYIHLLTAWQLQDTSGSRPLSRSILQHYVLCVETIVNAVIGKVKSQQAGKIKQAERHFAEKFALELPKRVDKPKAIREASTNLRKLGLQNTLPAIEIVAHALDLTSAVADQAKTLYQFRSSSLSHPGRTKPIDFDKWLRRGLTVTDLGAADALARIFLSAYCAWDGRAKDGSLAGSP